MVLYRLDQLNYNTDMNKVSKNNSVLELEKEVGLLRSYVIGTAGKDEEGEYRPEFVESMLKSLKEEPKQTFESPKGFLKQLKASE